jgi:leucyl-tRNA synthetase
MHSLLKQADYDFERIQYNTVVSACMKMLNAIEGAKLNERTEPSGAVTSVASEAFSILLRVLYPVVPHITWQLWRDLGFGGVHGDILDAPWPIVDPLALETDTVSLVLQVNGKLRGNLTVASLADKATIEALAIEHESVQKHLDGRAPKRVIVVPGKLVNVVG